MLRQIARLITAIYVLVHIFAAGELALMYFTQKIHTWALVQIAALLAADVAIFFLIERRARRSERRFNQACQDWAVLDRENAQLRSDIQRAVGEIAVLETKNANQAETIAVLARRDTPEDMRFGAGENGA